MHCHLSAHLACALLVLPPATLPTHPVCSSLRAPGPAAYAFATAAQLLTSQGERAALVNVRLDPALMDCVLDFLYRQAGLCVCSSYIKLTGLAAAILPSP